MRRRVNDEHGTYAGYQRHIRDRTNPCDECRAAMLDYSRQYRASENGKKVNAATRRAADHARRALAKNHPLEYRALLREYRRRQRRNR